MTTQEQELLKTAIATIADPAGNWNYGWEIICDLANVDPKKFVAPFRYRSEEELARLAKSRFRKPS